MQPEKGEDKSQDSLSDFLEKLQFILNVSSYLFCIITLTNIKLVYSAMTVDELTIY